MLFFTGRPRRRVLAVHGLAFVGGRSCGFRIALWEIVQEIDYLLLQRLFEAGNA